MLHRTTHSTFWFALTFAAIGFLIPITCVGQAPPTKEQLAKWLKRFPQADSNRDGELSVEEANAYRRKLRGGQTDRPIQNQRTNRNQGAPRVFSVDPLWDNDRFPEHAMCYRTPKEISETYAKTLTGKQPAVLSFDKPTDGALRIVGTGHSFMAPGYKTLPIICKAAGMDQPLYTHTGGGITGSTRYKWEQENGIFQFDHKPVPKLLASIANAQWDAMMWGPYFQDQERYYSCWVDFCLKYNPEMKFYLSDAWPQLYQLGKNPESEDFFTAEVLEKMGSDRSGEYVSRVNALREKYPNKIFVMPTSDAMVLAGKAFLKGELDGIEGLHKVIGKKERSLWRDQLGHLGPGFEWLEGYVFYATLYRKSPELIQNGVLPKRSNGFPSKKLDQQFRKLAWQAVINHPLSGVVDENGDGLADTP